MALRNEDLNQINKAHTLLGMIHAYTMELGNDFYSNTTITARDMQDCMKELNRIYTEQKLIKHDISVQSAEYKKTHKERRNLVQNINNAKKRNDKKKLKYWTQKLNKFNKGGE